MQKPLIGVLPLIDKEKESYWMLPGYMKGIEQAGGIPIMLPLTSDSVILHNLVNTCQGFLFTGGQDVSPAVYGKEPSISCGECSIEREQMEQILLSMALEKNKSILGSCRGIQFLNATLDGTLYQDLPTEHPSNIEHHQTPPYHIPVHKVTISPDSALYHLLGKQELFVNSYHHQAIDTLAPDLVPMAYSPDGLVEAVRLPGKKFVWAVQWHPEFSYQTDASSLKILQAFVDSAIK